MWNSTDGSPRQRSLFFCQAFDLNSSTGALDHLINSGALSLYWGRFVYWRDAIFGKGDVAGRFPNVNPGSRTLVTVGDMMLRLDVGTVPQTLDDCVIEASAKQDLILKLAGEALFSVGGVRSTSTALSVLLDAGAGFVAGAIGLEIPSMGTNEAVNHPLQLTQLVYVAEPNTLPSPGDDPVQCDVWQSQIAQKVIGGVGADPSCEVHLDLRDGINTFDWLKGELNSRLLFHDAEIHSTFFSPTGHRFLLKGVDGAAARIGFLRDMIDENQTMYSSGTMVFHPEGLFKIWSSAPPEAAASAALLNVSTRDFIAGSATTEFFDLGKDGDVTHIEFVKQQPAFLLVNEAEPSPTKRRLLDDRNGLVVTSYVRFAKAGVAKPVDFHSQSSEAPLFERSTSVPDHLQRLRKAYGSADKAMPVFAHAGFQNGNAPYTGLERFESTHLAQYRRNHAATNFTLTTNVVASTAATLAVTPQGILAQVRADGTYAQLYFGNPDSSRPREDFCLLVNDTGSQLYVDVQQALRASNLFMVMRKPTREALGVVTPAATLYTRDTFAFAIINPMAISFAAGDMQADALIVKYFKGRSIQDLLGDTSLWACRYALAPAGSSDLDAWSPFPAGKPVPDYLARLQALWVDPNWQGVLVLNAPMTGNPDLIEALRPGLASRNGAPELRAPYFGINALPAKADDLISTQAAPQRPGSAFGMVRYAKGEVGADPDAPVTDDVEPGTTGNQQREYALVVDSLRITFENSQIAEFSAKIFVLFDHLFWDELARPASGGLNSLELDGYYERHGAEDVFSLIAPKPFVISFLPDSYLKQLTVTRAQLSVASSDDKRLTALVGIDGTLEFNEKLTSLPLFSVKLIRLSSIGFEYDFLKQTGKGFRFRFKPDGISADIDFDSTGLPSLLSLMPVKLKGMSIAFGTLLNLGDLHFTPISFGGLGTSFQFGFLMELDFGSLGSLAGSLRGMRIPVLLGWGGGKNKGLAFGIQFPTTEGSGIDIGIQQFIRLQAKELNLMPCRDANNKLVMLGIQAVQARVVMLGKAWPEADTAFAIFIPVESGRKPSWAFGAKNSDTWYVGGGYRLKLPGPGADTVKAIVSDFETTLYDVGGKKQQICSLTPQAAALSDQWSVVGRYACDDLNVAVAISDPKIYGLAVNIPPFGELDVLYRRINSQLGIFSIEYTLPGELRTMQIGVATVRLPVFRLEIHTDGGFLADFGFPWNNDFSRSCQVEVAVFLGSGGFYYGVTSATATDLLGFDGGYGYLPPESATLNKLRTLRLGLAVRVGIGRSFTIGILYAEASVTIFGGVEGAIAYRPGSDLFSPTIYGMKGFVGLMVDIRATVDFSIIRASAHIVAYAEVGFEIRRVLAKNAAGEHRLLTLPVIIFAEIGLSVTAQVEIHVGCVDVTIYLSFSRTWHYEETLASLHDDGPTNAILTATSAAVVLAPLAYSWDTGYRYWPGQRDITIFATVLPCTASAGDVGETGDARPCAVGTLLVPVQQPANGFGDLVRFLVGWVLLPPGTAPSNIDSYSLTLDRTSGLLAQIRDPNSNFWAGFSDALLTVIEQQFLVKLTTLAQGQSDSFASLPVWPGIGFRYAPSDGGRPTVGLSTVVTDKESDNPMAASEAAFSQYCRHLIASTIPEIRQLLEDNGYVRNPDGTVVPNKALQANDPRKLLTWNEIWQMMFAPL
ncbi:hypothetical protein [Burkholderia pseudomallei]|uniref:hypothetical protein n=1 Tax=Burkholderia pseudomallei TaxID=28450 RepID=UPI0011C3F12E|nr:hypothetical protein [Burkholderia pseudomallei]